MMSTKNGWLISGVALLGFSLIAGCGGAVCGNGTLEEGEQCDDTNTNAGDGCDAVCIFEAPTTDFRISEIALVDATGGGRFNQTNLLLSGVVGNADLTKALNVLIKFDSTVEGTANVQFGPGTFNGDDTFSFAGNQATSSVTIDAAGLVTFDQAVDVFLPIETEVNSGIFVDLLIQDTLILSAFEKNQQGEGGLFVDEIKDGQIDAKVGIFDLCNLRIDLNADPAVAQEVVLLDIFDDGAISTPGQESSVVPGVGEVADATNCQPCAGPGANETCIVPDDLGDPVLADDDRYTVQAVFEAETVVIQ